MKEPAAGPRWFGAVLTHPSELVQGAILSSIIVLNFHLIGKPKRSLAAGEADVALSRQQFVDILDAIEGRNDVRLTFDDGNRSDVTVALPELMQRGLRAEFFVCPARFGTDEFVSEDDVRDLRRAGMSVGSHGMDHVQWRRLEPAAIKREIVEAKEILEDALNEAVETAACPFGAYDRRALRALRDAGFQRVYTSDRGWTTSGDWLVPRNTVSRWDSADTMERMLNDSGSTESYVRKAKRWIKRRW